MDKDELEFEQRLEEQEAKIKATLSNEGESLIETSSENEDLVAVNATDIAKTYGFGIVGRRWIATCVDGIFVDALLILSYIAALLSLSIYGVFIVLSAILLVGIYYVFMEGLAGITIGKAALGIRIVNRDFEVPGIKKALIRTAFRLVEINPFLFGGIPALIVATASKDKQRLGDMVAGTYVLRKRDFKDIHEKSPLSVAKKLAVGLILIALIGGIVGESVFVANNIGNFKGFGSGISGDTIYTKDKKFQVALPSGWRKDDTIFGKDSDFESGAMRIFDGEAAGILTIDKDETGYFNLNSYAKIFYGVVQNMEMIKNPKAGKMYSKKVNGFEAKEFEITAEIENEKAFFYFTLFDTKNHLILLQTWVMTDSVTPTQRKDLQDVIDGFGKATPKTT